MEGTRTCSARQGRSWRASIQRGQASSHSSVEPARTEQRLTRSGVRCVPRLASAPLVSAPVSRDEQRDAIADLASWTATAKAQENALRSAAKAAASSASSAAAQRHSIPIRGHAADSAFEPAPNSASAQLKQKNAAAGVDLGQELDPSLLTPAELAAAATSEKEKGNECFRAGEHVDAVRFYTRALHLTPKDTTILNNRALTFLKQKNLDAALNDVMLVLAADPTNWKGLWRRGQIHEAKLFLERALDDFKLAQESWARTAEARTNPTHPDIAKNVRKVQKALLETEPNHPYVAHLKDKPASASAWAAKPKEEKENKEPEGPAAATSVAAATTFKRMAIAEVDDDESDEEAEEEKSDATAPAAPAKTQPAAATTAPAAASAPMRRMPIAEVEDDDDDESAAAPAAASAAKPASAAAAAPKPAAAAPAPVVAPTKKPSQPSQPAFTSKSGGMMIELVSDEEDAEEKEKTAGAAKSAAGAARPAASSSSSSASASSSSSSSLPFVVPPAPSSSVLFSRDWAELNAADRSSDQRWAYFAQIAPNAVVKLFSSGGALNTATFAGLLSMIVDSGFAADAARAIDYLSALERTDRFALNVNMLDKAIKARVADKLEQLTKGGNEEVASKAAAVRKRYV